MADETQNENIADIVSTLVVLDRGRFVIEVGREFQELIDSIIETNKPGTISIKLKVAPSGWKKGTGRPNQFDFQPEVSIAKPRNEAGKTIFFVTDDNKLTRDDPDQIDMFEEREAKTNARR